MRKIIILVALCGLLILTGCRKPAVNTDATLNKSETSEILEEDLRDIPYEIISESQYGNGNYGFTAKYEEDSVLLTICRGEKSSGGYDLSVESVVGNEEKITVTVSETDPDSMQTVTAALTYPSCTVRISALADSIVVKNTSGAEYPNLKAEGTVPVTQQSGRMVMANGKLYMDTGYVSGIYGRCGTLDGNITSVIDASRTPAKDGEANFAADGWQIGFETKTIEVPVNGDFCIFAESGSEIFTKNKIPDNVLQFTATVDSVTDDSMTVTVFGEISERFGNIIQTGKTYRVNREAYNPGIYTEEPIPGSVVIIACKNETDEKDPSFIPCTYSISPVGSSPMQNYVKDPAEEDIAIDEETGMQYAKNQLLISADLKE